MLDVGRVLRPHGLKGDVVVEVWTNRPERTLPGARLTADGRQLTVVSASHLPASGGRERWLMTFEGVADRASAEALRDVVLRAEPLDVAGALWVHSLVGAELHALDGAPVGRVAAVEANPASDLLVLEDGRLVPLTFVFVAEDGRLTVDGPPGLLDAGP